MLGEFESMEEKENQDSRESQMIVENQNRLKFFLEDNKDSIQSVLNMALIVTSVVGFVSGIWSFGIYLFDMQYFNRWNIDMIFYANVSFMNKLIYIIGIVCILLLFIIFVSDDLKKIKLQTLFFVLFNILLGISNGINNGLGFSWITSYIIVPLVIYFLILKSDLFVKLRKNLKKYEVINNIAKPILILIFSVFLVLIFYGIIDAYFLKKEYKIIQDDSNQCQVILYSTKDYHIVSNCIMYENNLSIDKDVQKKISAEGIEYEIMKFDNIMEMQVVYRRK